MEQRRGGNIVPAYVLRCLNKNQQRVFFCLRSRILHTLHLSSSKFFQIRENGRRPIGNIENSTIVSALFWILTTRSRRMEEGREQKGGKEVGKRKKYDKKGRDIRKVFESEYKIRSLAIFNLVFYRKSERCCFSSATHRWDYIITE